MSISSWATKQGISRNLTMQLSLTAVCFLLGVLLVTQFRTQVRITKTIPPASSADQVAIIAGLVENNAQLRGEVELLEKELAQYRSDLAEGKSNLDTLASDLERMRILNGLVEVTGPGARIVVDAPLRVSEVQDFVNELRNSGAEGIALNGRRVVGRTGIAKAAEEGQLLVDMAVVSAPYTFEVIGDQETLRTALERKGGMVSLLRYNYGERAVRVETVDKLVLPLYKGVYDFVHARAVKQ